MVMQRGSKRCDLLPVQVDGVSDTEKNRQRREKRGYTPHLSTPKIDLIIYLAPVGGVLRMAWNFRFSPLQSLAQMSAFRL